MEINKEGYLEKKIHRAIIVMAYVIWFNHALQFAAKCQIVSRKVEDADPTGARGPCSEWLPNKTKYYFLDIILY